uniref:Prefoldin subunit 4 n=1 Tax=Craspedostauros australis TaxID=1486917 RepID=A0A7R9ZLJ0_9STRA|mmetsp:Transcript_17346/g.48071  ORF Transcript_17346/g.48071 Transcript_17346/m.48071 type:complete len:129 (+) Transcript_17346:189-575(+)
MLKPEQENEIDFRREDQININRFARLNSRLHDVRDDRDLFKKSLERLDDASTELMMQESSDKVMLLIGESFFETSEDDATEYVEAEVERLQALVDKLEEEEAEILEKQAELKKVLYGRFGSSIQLEEK